MNPPAGAEMRRLERIPTTIHKDARAASAMVARQIADLIRERAAQGKKAVLGLATGSTPMTLYKELIRLHTEEGLSFANVITFNLDEYYPMRPEDLQSYVRFMRERLFDHLDMPRGAWHVPDGTLPQSEVAAYCRAYEAAIEEAGGLDVQVLGIGRTGHIGFNEPGSSIGSRTRLILLNKVTRIDAASAFFGEENVPRRALSMGIATILAAKKVFLLAWGEDKAEIVAHTVEGPVDPGVPATFLQNHPDTEVVLDSAAAACLTRVKAPWTLGPVQWEGAGHRYVRKAVTWLAQHLKKPILSLTEEDYMEHGMSDLVTERGATAYDINVAVFKDLSHLITGWPGGKPDADDAVRPERALPYPKRVLIFSPHPDDDVISMGGTLHRLLQHGHEVHIAYQTSGSIAVFDDDALRFVDFAHRMADTLGDIMSASSSAMPLSASSGALGRPGSRGDVLGMVGEEVHEEYAALNAPDGAPRPDGDGEGEAAGAARDEGSGAGGAGAGGAGGGSGDGGAAMARVQSLARAHSAARRVTGGIYHKIRAFLETKRPGQVDLPEVLQVKGLIRLGEARAACRYLGVKDDNVHFLNMPFYDTGLVRKKPLSEDDITLVRDLLDDVRPHQVFAAGDLSDPHGTHRTCLAAVLEALTRLHKARDWMQDCRVWLYRGAWQEWGVEQMDMAVPLGPGELRTKRRAIYKHQSQKDRPLFPGPDEREFWQRAEARNRDTAALFDRLGLPEYHAMEAFVRLRMDDPLPDLAA